MFAERAYAARVIVEGEDSPAVIKAKCLTERPKEHWSYRRFMSSSTASKSPQPVDVKELEDWLWMEGEWSEYNGTSSVDDYSDTPGLDPWMGIRQLLAEAGREIEPSEVRRH
jgi:hypothetical protein